MFKSLWGKLSGTHLTIMFVAALATPGAVYAVSYSSVAITDPNTGLMAFVDAGRRVYTYNPVEGYTNNPQYLVNIKFFATDTNSHQVVYTVPTGKVLLVKSLGWSYYNNTEGNDVYLYLDDGTDTYFYNFEGIHVAGDAFANFGAGIIVRAGAIYADFYDGGHSSASQAYIQGYLIPATAVPAPGTPEASAQFVAGPKGNSQRR